MYKVVKYGAFWCGPCVMMDQLMKRAQKEYPEVIFENVNVDKPENKCYLVEYNIIALPTIITFKNDKVVSKTTGALSYQTLDQLIQNLLQDGE